MNERGRHRTGKGSPDDDHDDREVRAHQSRPGRVVFTEQGNTDAWIASDLTVDPDP